MASVWAVPFVFPRTDKALRIRQDAAEMNRASCGKKHVKLLPIVLPRVVVASPFR